MTVVPLNVMVLLPCVVSNFCPEIVTEFPTTPDVGVSPLMQGPVVNVTPLLSTPFTVTTMDPVLAPQGTGARMLVSVQFDGVALVPLNFTVLVPCVVPKRVPVIVTDVPTGPEEGAMPVMPSGFGTTSVES